MTLSEVTQLVTSLTALVVSIFAVIKFYRIPAHERTKLSADTQKSDAEASKTFEEAAQLASDRANRLESRLTKLEGDFRLEVDRLNTVIKERDMQIEQLVKELKTKDEVIVKLQDWAERLVHQIQSLGEEPVPFDKPPERKRARR